MHDSPSGHGGDAKFRHCGQPEIQKNKRTVCDQKMTKTIALCA
jgi:hypothetical protein